MMDIAREAGVSQSTVSRVLNDVSSPVPIAPDTRERVRAAARRLNYSPNPLARALRGAPTMLIGAIVRDITDPFFTGAVDALSNEVMARGYNVVLGHAHARAEEAIALKAVLETRHCDSIVLLGDMRDQPRLIVDLQESRTPVVALWQGSRLDGIPSVNVDNAAGIEAVIAHLIAMGHKRIGFVGGRHLGDHRDRKQAFVEILERLGTRPPKSYIRDVSNNPTGGSEALSALLRLAEPPTAVVMANDQLAIGALHAAHELGVKVPDDLSITGFDDIPMAAFTVPALTTVRMPIVEMIAAAVGMVVDSPRATLSNRATLSSPDTSVVLQPSLVVRASTAWVPSPRHAL